MAAAPLRRAVGLVGGLALALGLLVAVLLVRAALLRPEPRAAEPVALRAVDAQAVARRLAEAVRIPTISYQEREALDADAFRRLHAQLERSYPRVHRSLRRERVNELSLLYTWPGSEPEAPALLLAAHLDVVPVDEDEWQQPPFSGRIADGEVWGRGTIDDKGSLICILEAVEHLLAEGFTPRRTVYLAFGHDEEVSGNDGAQRIAAHLAAAGARVGAVLDEGGAVASGYVPGLDRPIAVIGIAEKGSVSIALDLEGAGGHSSTPPARTVIGELSRALVRLEEEPMPGGIDGVTALFLDRLAPELPFWLRVPLANRWLFDPLLELAAGRIPTFAAMMRTSTAVTIFEAGVKENVLPIRARAVANFRIHPRDSVEKVLEHVRAVVDDERVQLTAGVRSPPREPSPVSPVDHDDYRLITRSLVEVYPGTAPVPYLVVGGTDARFYKGLTDRIYRFAPFALGRDTQRLMHGTDERITLENLVNGVRFYDRLLRNTASAE